VSEPSDGDGSDTSDPKDAKKADANDESSSAKIRSELDVPATRKQEALKEPAEPPARPSQLEIKAEPLTYPDDGPVSAKIRRIDNAIGRGEQIVLVALLVTIVVVAAGSALLDKIATYRVEFKDDVIHGGTFALAMIGASYATQQARNLSMDLLSRRFSPRARLFLKVMLGLFTIFIVAIVIRAGFHTIDIQTESDAMISAKRIAWTIPIGGGLIILHSLLHLLIDVDYIARRKTPPERMRSGH
jgi:TRAP-type C4-dicarboxylate transport system permease small subunit